MVDALELCIMFLSQPLNIYPSFASIDPFFLLQQNSQQTRTSAKLSAKMSRNMNPFSYKIPKIFQIHFQCQ